MQSISSNLAYSAFLSITNSEINMLHQNEYNCELWNLEEHVRIEKIRYVLIVVMPIFDQINLINQITTKNI